MGISASHLARLEALVRGRVQGVGYRFFVRREAAALGLRGYARNRADGAVEVIAEGERATLERFVEALQRGPSAADVDEVETRWSTGEGTFSGFQIRH